MISANDSDADDRYHTLGFRIEDSQNVTEYFQINGDGSVEAKKNIVDFPEYEGDNKDLITVMMMMNKGYIDNLMASHYRSTMSSMTVQTTV